MCGWTVLSNPCMHACSHIHAHSPSVTQRHKSTDANEIYSTVNEYTRTYTNTLAYTRDTDRQTVLMMCAAGSLLLLSLLFGDNSARIDFDGTNLQANHPFLSISLSLLSKRGRRRTEREHVLCAWICLRYECVYVYAYVNCILNMSNQTKRNQTVPSQMNDHRTYEQCLNLQIFSCDLMMMHPNFHRLPNPSFNSYKSCHFWFDLIWFIRFRTTIIASTLESQYWSSDDEGYNWLRFQSFEWIKLQIHCKPIFSLIQFLFGDFFFFHNCVSLCSHAHTNTQVYSYFICSPLQMVCPFRLCMRI